MRKLFLFSALLFVLDGAIALQAVPQRSIARTSWASGASRVDEDCWGKDQKCSDGKYRDQQGREQPESCDNFGATGSAKVHDCACGKAMQHKDDCDNESYAGDKCKVYCREHACKCKSMECS